MIGAAGRLERISPATWLRGLQPGSGAMRSTGGVRITRFRVNPSPLRYSAGAGAGAGAGGGGGGSVQTPASSLTVMDIVRVTALVSL